MLKHGGEGVCVGGNKTAGLTVKHSSFFDPPNLSFTPSHSHPIVREKKKREKKKKEKEKKRKKEEKKNPAAHFL